MNRLATETSPYLRQHADNPVDWYPWGREALAAARELDRPLFVSIGYAACHWCHVMAHESFEDEGTAERINAAFVPVKVDREERPDVDAVYMEAVQALTGSGGWPLSVFATPDGRPFFGGTYFPSRPVAGMPTFRDVLDAVERAWSERRELVASQADELTSAVALRLAGPDAAGEGGPGARELLGRAFGRFAELYDAEHGGIGGAPKFPQPPMLELVLRAHLAGSGDALEMVQHTLGEMAAGGIYDHLEGGFARYSVDAAWQVPHFEKMLYDQALLAKVYLHAWQVTGDPRWRQVVEETVAYVLTRLAGREGGWCASEDADSEGAEGRFATWTPAELEEVLGERARLAAAAYGVTSAGNFEGGRSVLHRPPGEVLRDAELEEVRRALAAARARRVRPARDDKVLTEWNAMFLATLAEAAPALGRPDWLQAALEGAEFLLRALRGEGGRWRRAYMDGKAGQLAVAGDYAWLVECFTRLGEATGAARWAREARRTAGELVALFSDGEGRWYMTGADAEALVVRPRELHDGVVPAAGSVAAAALARIGALTADESLTSHARAAVAAAGSLLAEAPLAVPHLLLAAELLEAGPIEVVVTGDRRDLVEALARRHLPYVVLAWGEPTGSPLFGGRDGPLAWVCRRGTCLLPTGDEAALLRLLGPAGRAA